MAFKILILVVAISGLALANPTINKAPMMDEMRSTCTDGTDSLACLKDKVMNFMDSIFKKDIYQLSDDIEVRSNGFTDTNEVTGRSDADLTDKIENYIQSHDVTFKLPVAGAKVTISPKSINENELNLKFKFTDEGRSAEPRKSKLKKIVLPILVFVLLKAMTVIPLALGVLGLKAWNAVQLSFFSFVISIGLAIFQLCKKLAQDHHHPQIAAHGPWDRRSLNSAIEPSTTYEAGQILAYNAYN